MAETLSLMEFLQALLSDAELRTGFGHDPQGTLAGHGLADLSPADVHDALVLVQDNQTVDFGLDPAPAPPPPPPASDGHEAAVEYLARYIAAPQQPAVAEQWADIDPDAAAPTPVRPDDSALGSFGGDDDGGYGAGALGTPADRWGHDPADLDLAVPDAAPGTAVPTGGDDLGGYDPGEYDDLDGSGPDGGDLGSDPAEHGDDPGLPGGP